MFGHTATVNTCTFSPKGDFFATGGADGTLLLWNSAFVEPTG
jgi:WD40 repeat protein